ncbi:MULTISPECIES: hypothetical protein [Phyllobacteriaceae]|uniref:hypothetical protein n=1 Tax=Phyllobacteriaceae TaxID=69277 RepID=UPI0012FE8D6A|nr:MULTISPECIES: hypothetical protein [Phyllobacteriaceae]
MSIVFNLVREFSRIRDQSVRNGMRQMSDSKRMGISADTLNEHCEVRLRDKLKQRSGMPCTTCKEGSPKRIITAQKVQPPLNIIRLRIIVE